MKQITKDDIWDVSKCDLTCTDCGTTMWNGKDMRCGITEDNINFVSIVLLRDVLKDLEAHIEEWKVHTPATINLVINLVIGLIDEAFVGVIEK